MIRYPYPLGKQDISKSLSELSRGLCEHTRGPGLELGLELSDEHVVLVDLVNFNVVDEVGDEGVERLGVVVVTVILEVQLDILADQGGVAVAGHPAFIVDTHGGSCSSQVASGLCDVFENA